MMEFTKTALIDLLTGSEFNVIDSGDSDQVEELFWVRVEADHDDLLRLTVPLMRVVWSVFTCGLMDFNGFIGDGRAVVVIKQARSESAS